MYVINLPTAECSSVEMTNQKIPNPGQFILQGDTTSIAPASGPSCSASAAAQTQGVKGYLSNTLSNIAALSAPATDGDVTGKPTGTAAASSAYSAPASSPAEPTAQSQPATSSGPLTISTAASSVPAQSAPAPTQDPAPVPSKIAPSATVVPPSGGSNATSGTTCSDEGAVICSGTTQFGLCNHGSVVFMPVADGTECMNGQVVKKRSLVAKERRNAHARLHARHLAAGIHNTK